MQLLWYILFVLLGHAMGIRESSPVGPRMCASLCRSTYGCSMYVFSRPHLTCHLVNDQYTWEGPAVKMDNTQFQVESLGRVNSPCQMFSLIFYNRGGTICCVKHTDSVVYRASNRTLRSRLLVTNFLSSRNKPVYQIFTDDFSPKIYPNLNLKGVKAVTYFPPSRALIVSQSYQRKILAISVDTNIKTTIKENIICNAVAIDEKRNLLVLAVLYAKSAVYTMTSDGRKYSLLFHLNMIKEQKRMYPTAIVMDTKRDLFYICLHKSIISVDHKGNTTEIIRGRGRNLYGMTFHSHENVLYYSHGDKLKKLSLPGKKEIQIKNFHAWVNQLVYYKGYVHVTLFRDKHIHSIPTTNQNKPFSTKLPLKDIKQMVLSTLT